MTSALVDKPRSALRAPDDQLARAAGRGDVGAFEELYERHHRGLLSFARHMLGRLHDAEDVVQHTFLAADRAFRAGSLPASVRAWLYVVARNRCISILRARRDDHALPGRGVPSAQNLAEDVELREDLRALLADLRTLPDDQRAALLLAELGELSHAEVAEVLGVRDRKVKALVFQARQALLAAAGARAIPCRSIRDELAVATGSSRRRRHLREHMAACDGCRDYAAGVARQRSSLAAILPVVPTVALRDTIIGCLGSGGAAAGGGAGIGLSVAGAKLLAIAAIGGAAAGGGTVALTAPDQPRPEAAAARSAAPPTPVRTDAVATGAELGRSNGGAVDRSNGRAVGRPNGRAVGRSNGRAVGRSNGRAAVPSNGRAVGRSNSRAAGPSNGRAAGPYDGRAAGPSNSRAAGPYDGRAAGPSNGRAAGASNGRGTPAKPARSADPNAARSPGKAKSPAAAKTPNPATAKPANPPATAEAVKPPAAGEPEATQKHAAAPPAG